jgi:3-oxoacyl-[acyl-carrier protein] reductase
MFLSKSNLRGKVAIVTGGGRGIGRAIALLLAEEGCSVVICSRTEKELKEASEEIKKNNKDVLAIKADVSKLNNVKAVVNETIKKFGKIDILVNNAGIGPYKPLVETGYDEIDAIIDINLKGLIYFTKESLPYLKEEYGRVINISSGIGKGGMANFTVYCATKFGVIGFTESLAGELKGNIKTYAVCPGAIDTRLYRSNFPNSRNIFLDSPKKVAKVVSKLCEPDCKVKNGGVVDV